MFRQSKGNIAVGIEIGLCIIIGMLLGQQADAWFGTTPWLFWTGVVLGIGAALKAVVSAVNRTRRALENDDSGKTDRN